MNAAYECCNKKVEMVNDYWLITVFPRLYMIYIYYLYNEQSANNYMNSLQYFYAFEMLNRF